MAIVNETFARQLWPGEFPLGKPCQVIGSDPSQPCEIIGIVRDSAYADFTGEMVATRYRPFLQLRNGRGLPEPPRIGEDRLTDSRVPGRASRRARKSPRGGVTSSATPVLHALESLPQFEAQQKTSLGREVLTDSGFVALARGV